MISHKHKCILIHVPKTGGCSMELALGGHLGIMENQEVDMEKTSRRGWHRQLHGFYENQGKKIETMHLGARGYKHRFRSLYNNYYKFAFVRNPFDRLVSAWHSDHLGTKTKENWSFKQFLSTLNQPWLESTRRNMVDYILDQDNKMIVDFVGRYENINSDWEKVTKSLGTQILLPKVNTAFSRKPYQEEYDNTTKKIVEEYYKRDLEYFNYRF